MICSYNQDKTVFKFDSLDLEYEYFCDATGKERSAPEVEIEWLHSPTPKKDPNIPKVVLETGIQFYEDYQGAMEWLRSDAGREMQRCVDRDNS